MRIGLARHFLVPHRRSESLDSEGFARWISWYDDAEGHGEALDLLPANGTTWDLCYCSDLRRAHATAQQLHVGRVERTSLLREVPFAPTFQARVRIPLYLWQGLARAGWFLGHGTQPEGRRQTLGRAGEFIDRVCTEHAGQNVLVVGHGFLMQVLARELRRRGFRGRVPMRPLGGRIYVFEKR